MEAERKMKELEFGSLGFFDALVDVRERRVETRIIVRGRKAKRLAVLVPLFEDYRKQAESHSPSQKKALLKFGLRALVCSPSFWATCVYLAFEVKRLVFRYDENVLSADFFFD